VLSTKYADVGDFHDGLAYFEEGGKYGFINKKGDVVIKAQYDSVEAFDKGLARVINGTEAKLIDVQGKVVADAAAPDVEVPAPDAGEAAK
jgi:hypothetical protein